ncbi:MAG: histidine-type phosphatase [Rikenellaceae bacterium]|nr:histidine-type phosphatase [Rikenellaceae bacterium]
MKRLFTLLTLIFVSTASLSAQSSRDEIMADINRAGGVYYGYTTPTAAYTPAPKGYEPFYISHYGRHGSRYSLKDEYYNSPVQILNKAHKAGKLTAFGEDVRNRMLKIYAVAERRGGELTQRGVRQHEEIATRMTQNFPEIFKQKGLKVNALSSVIPRCLVSMSAFCDGLKTQNPTIEITRDASDAKMIQIHYFRPEWNKKLPPEVLEIIANENSYWRMRQREEIAKHIDFSRVLENIFSDKEFISTFNESKFWLYLVDIALNVQCLDIEDVSLYDVFTKDELYEYWRSHNFSYYARYGKYLYYPLMASVGADILNAIIAQIDSDIAAGTPSVSLRFGHDTCLFSISPLMGLPGCTVATTDYDTINEVWRNYRLTPMAANLQMIFYRKKGSDDILVRVMLNEQEVHFDFASKGAPYYRWEDLKGYWKENIRKATQF